MNSASVRPHAFRSVRNIGKTTDEILLTFVPGMRGTLLMQPRDHLRFGMLLFAKSMQRTGLPIRLPHVTLRTKCGAPRGRYAFMGGEGLFGPGPDERPADPDTTVRPDSLHCTAHATGEHILSFARTRFVETLAVDLGFPPRHSGTGIDIIPVSDLPRALFDYMDYPQKYQTLEHLYAHAFPGVVRELSNFLEFEWVERYR